MEIKINNQNREVFVGETILEACRRNAISIPTLCNMKNIHEGVCRLCVVEMGGRLVTACNTKVAADMEIVTESEQISQARKINLELLWADHAGKCLTCKKNRRCELQNLAGSNQIDAFRFVPKKEELTSLEELDLLKDNFSRVVVDEANAAIARTTELCVECRHCINVCPTQEFSFNHRAGDVVVGTPYEKPLDCIFCGQCVKHCPTGAITDQNNLEEVVAQLDDVNKIAIVLWDPALRESMALEQPEIGSGRKLIGALKAIGFEVVLDLGFGMELFLTESKKAIQKNPQNNLILSHCPALNLYIEKYYPQFQSNILDVLTPDELLAQHIKTEYAQKHKINPANIVVVAISSCVAKKIKKDSNLDYVLTMRELGRIIRQKHVKLAEVAGAEFSRDLLVKSKGVEKMVHCGGAAELLAKSLHCEYLVANEVKAIKNLLENLSKKRVRTKLIEMMICPGGCVGGGGQSRKF